MQKRTDMFQFLREFTSFLHSLQQTREPFFKTLHEHGILTVIEVALVSLILLMACIYFFSNHCQHEKKAIRDDKVNTIAMEILSQFVEAAPTLVREFILNEVEQKLNSKSTGSNSNNNSNNNSLNMSNSSFKQLPSTPVSSHVAISSNFLLSTASSSSSLSQTPTSSSSSSSGSKEETQLQMQTQSLTSQFDASTLVVNQSFNLLSLTDILNTDDVFEPVLINFIIRQMINDPDPELSGAMQIVNLLKLLIDPENMLSAANVSCHSLNNLLLTRTF